MTIITANDFLKDHGALSKFPHTGPIYWGTGARPYSAALKGVALRRMDGIVREFKTADSAVKAIKAASVAS